MGPAGSPTPLSLQQLFGGGPREDQKGPQQLKDDKARTLMKRSENLFSPERGGGGVWRSQAVSPGCSEGLLMATHTVHRGHRPQGCQYPQPAGGSGSHTGSFASGQRSVLPTLGGACITGEVETCARCNPNTHRLWAWGSLMGAVHDSVSPWALEGQLMK